MSGIVLGTVVGVGCFAGKSSSLASFALGAVLTAYALLALASPRFQVPRRHEWWVGSVSGVITGMISGGTGIFVIPMVPFLASLGLGREALIQALGSAFTVAVLALGLCLWAFGKVTPDAGTLSLIAIIPAFIGMAIGQWLRQRLSAEAFRRVFLSSILLLGGWMMLHAAL
jgi:uncharacterized membrane protein YfcA